jgi:(R,R)-butanediol dehydrogenase/meso-butanediol dehydrogenase/diacetyl reductase
MVEPVPTMAAAVLSEGAQITVEQRPVPVPGPGEALVEVGWCGICGTDLHFVFDGYGRAGQVLGHEWAGVVAAVGEGVTGWAVGDEVVAGPDPGCGACRPCRRGRPSACRARPPIDYHEFTGAFARYVVKPVAQLIAVPPGLGLRAAALTEPTAVVLHAVSLSGVQPDDRVLVTGAGPIGLLTTAVLRARGIDDVTVSEPTPRRRERALAVGARRVVTPADLPGAPPIGRPQPDAFDVAFECSGKAVAVQSALDQLDFAGVLVFVGTATGTDYPVVNHNRMIVLEQTALGSVNYDPDGFRDALALLAGGRLPVDELVEPEDVPLDGLLAAMHRLSAGELAGKVLVRPGAVGREATA